MPGLTTGQTPADAGRYCPSVSRFVSSMRNAAAEPAGPRPRGHPTTPTARTSRIGLRLPPGSRPSAFGFWPCASRPSGPNRTKPKATDSRRRSHSACRRRLSLEATRGPLLLAGVRLFTPPSVASPPIAPGQSWPRLVDVQGSQLFLDNQPQHVALFLLLSSEGLQCWQRCLSRSYWAGRDQGRLCHKTL